MPVSSAKQNSIRVYIKSDQNIEIYVSLLIFGDH